MSNRSLIVLTAALFVTTSLASSHTTHSPPLAGVWRLASYKQMTPDGASTDLYGPHPLGQLIYDAAGHMSVHLLMPDLPKCATLDRRKCPDATARAAFDNYLGYWGRFKLSPDGKSITHVIEGASAPDWIGTSQERFFELSDDRLTLTTPIQSIGGIASKSVLVWEREKWTLLRPPP